MQTERTDNLLRLARLLFRADSIIADIEFHRHASRAGLGLAALLIAVFGIIMGGVAGFFALEMLWGPIWAAVAVSGASFVLALLLILIAISRRPGRELDLALELHKSSLDALVAEIRGAGRDLTSIDLRHPFDSALVGMIGPLASIMVKGLRRATKKD